MSILSGLRGKAACDSATSATREEKQEVTRKTPATDACDTCDTSRPAAPQSRKSRKQESQPNRAEPRAVTGESQESQSRKVADSNAVRIARLRKERARRAREGRRDAVLRMMDGAPPETTHFYLTDDRSHPDFVILAFGIRGAGVGELSIPRASYDPFTLLDVLSAAHAPGEHEDESQGGGYMLGSTEPLEAERGNT